MRVYRLCSATHKNTHVHPMFADRLPCVPDTPPKTRLCDNSSVPFGVNGKINMPQLNFWQRVSLAPINYETHTLTHPTIYRIDVSAMLLCVCVCVYVCFVAKTFRRDAYFKLQCVCTPTERLIVFARHRVLAPFLCAIDLSLSRGHKQLVACGLHAGMCDLG